MRSEPPAGVLDSRNPWYTAKVGERTWKLLKLKLTGKKDSDGTHYTSTVNLSDSDADKLIENMKKDPRGYPQFNDGGGGTSFYKNYEVFQKWLVGEYLDDAVKESPQKPESKTKPTPKGRVKKVPKKKVVSESNVEPLGLEELINSIRDEEKREKALAIYEGTRQDDLVSEEVDERILNLIGIDDVFDIDYSTYMSLLREKMMQVRMTSSKLSTDESVLLTDEFKRIKGKTGRFKIKKKKISNSISISGSLKQSEVKYFLTGEAETIQPQTKDSVSEDKLLKNVVTINETLEKILAGLISQNKAIKKGQNLDRKAEENQRRASRESSLEKGVSKVSNVASKMLAPVKGIFDKILNFLLYTLLGRAFTKLVEWFGDDSNKKKIDTIVRFLKDFWPALLGGLLLFTTPLGKFVRFFIGNVIKLTLRLAKFAIPKLLKFIGKNKLLSAGALIVGGAAIGGIMQSQTQSNDPERAAQGKTQLDDTQEFGGITGSPISGKMLGFRNGGYIDDDTGIDITGAGPDTQLLAAQPGEIVMSKKAVDTYGAGYFLGLNKAAGGTNIPKFVNRIQFAQGGGMVGKSASNLINSKAKKIFDRLVSGGLTKTAAAGIVANLGVETGYTYDPGTMQESGGPGRGLAQWEAGGRYDTDNINLKSFASSMGKPWDDLNTQVDFILHEMKVHPEYKLVKSELNSAKSTEDATRIFLQKYEKAGVGHLDRRMQVVQAIKDAGYLKPPKKPAEITKTKPAGPKGILESLTDDKGLSKYIPKNIRNLFAPKSSPSVPGPPVSNINQSSIIQLPDIVQQSGQTPNLPSGSDVPNIPHSLSETSAINANIYGIG